MARFRLRPWPFMEPRCHLHRSPFRMSWICCTMRLIATEWTWRMGFLVNSKCLSLCSCLAGLRRKMNGGSQQDGSRSGGLRRKVGYLCETA
uniref:Uncharacterized protein n=1 Tax=Salarias fasciatus TaxID=181472 RepID=A0A672ICD4_SALFA